MTWLPKDKQMLRFFAFLARYDYCGRVCHDWTDISSMFRLWGRPRTPTACRSAWQRMEAPR